MKKVFGVYVFLLSMLALVSAQGGVVSGLSKGMSQVIGMIEGFLGPFFMAILGGESGYLFEKVLFLVIVLSVVYLVTKKIPVFPDKGPILWIVSISIALLSTRFMDGDLLATMLLPYSALGVGLTALIPLILMYYFVDSFEGQETLKKLLWIFYIVTFVTLWSVRYSDVEMLANIYLGSAMVAIVLMLTDKKRARARRKQKNEHISYKSNQREIARLRKELDDLEENRKNLVVSVYEEDRKDLLKRIDKLNI